MSIKKYKIIYADVPWTYNDTLGGNASMGAMPYKTMNLEDIKNLDIQSIADKDCILFFWATMPKLKEAFEVIEAWGFKYKTCAFTWVKQNPKSKTIFAGLGRWVQGNAELCLLATKGKPHRILKSVKQIVLAPRSKHSAKPPIIRNKIVELMGDISRIELFARQATLGWDAIGFEIDGKNIVESLKLL
jgi:site-specific DNA-methyltransferase (adenine-specific)